MKFQKLDGDTPICIREDVCMVKVSVTCPIKRFEESLTESLCRRNLISAEEMVDPLQRSQISAEEPITGSLNHLQARVDFSVIHYYVINIISLYGENQKERGKKSMF